MFQTEGGCAQVTAQPERAYSPIDRTQADQVLKLLVEHHVALAFGVGVLDLRRRRRGKCRAAFARQAAMYLVHVVGGLSFTATGAVFGRDRTTVAHACALVEDCRDEVLLDHLLEAIERLVMLHVGRGTPAFLLDRIRAAA
jgi:chromosomal replication initiation ATPase DnaA